MATSHSPILKIMRRLLFILFGLYVVSFASYGANDNLDEAINKLQQGQFKEAFSLFKRLAGTNNVTAQFYVAQCYEHGIGVDANESEAFFMYRRAAERGFAPAMYDIAKCYRNGIGVAPNKDRAVEWEKRYASKQQRYDMVDIVAIYQSTPEVSPLLAENSSPQPVVVGNQTENTVQPKVIIQTQPSQKVNNPTTSTQEKKTEEKKAPLSDVDVNIPISGKVNENTFALIIANENYLDVASVPNAINDGEIFSQYCNKVLGMPQTNIHFVKDATLNYIKREINLIKNIAEVYKGDASFIVYYAGHGIPDEKTQNAYILPIDGFTADLSTCYGLADFYDLIGGISSKQVVVFLDACFSGSQRGKGMLASARGIAIKSKMGVPSGNTIVISSAQGDETAYPFEEQHHGLFTYFLLKKLQESKGDVDLGSLVEYLTDNVTKKSLVVNGKSQTPTANPSVKITNDWKNWKLY